ncbi:MAG: preprotein translocase subunit SecG [Candidatus Tenebribacter burtonii]|jgi:preprotein translocase subunit SecG|nr:preprotein translocase subunit SecG [Candidatus Tenebribacter burtonii]
MYTILMVIHVIISIALILVILAQSSKGGALDGMVGGAASNVLGGQGASKFLKNATQILAVLFMINCILLAFQLRGGTSSSVSSNAVDKMKKEQVTEQPLEQEELPILPIEEPVKETTE